MNQYNYVVTCVGPCKACTSLDDALLSAVDLVFAPGNWPVMMWPPRLWIKSDNGALVGGIYFADRDAKILAGADNPDVVHVCCLLHAAIRDRIEQMEELRRA